MSLILEDGTGLDTATSYASRAEGDAYHADRLYATAWTGASDGDKDKALIMATRALDTSYEWYGYRLSTEQRLEWPRVRVPWKDVGGPGYGYGVALGRATGGCGAYYPEDEIPRILKDATCDMARELLAGDRTAEDAAKGIKRLGLGQGALEVEFDASDRKTTTTDEITRLLAPIGRPRGHRSTVRVTRV